LEKKIWVSREDKKLKYFEDLFLFARASIFVLNPSCRLAAIGVNSYASSSLSNDEPSPVFSTPEFVLFCSWVFAAGRSCSSG